MNYFLANFGAHIIVLAILLVALFITSNRTMRRKVKHTLTYFLPVVLCIAVFVDVVLVIAPRCFDLSVVIKGKFEQKTGVVEDVGYFNNTIVIDGVTYYVNPFRDIPKEGSTVEFKYTNESKYALAIVVINDTDEEDDSVEVDEDNEATETSESVKTNSDSSNSVG